MAKSKEIEEFIEPSNIHETLLIGCLWSNPSNYNKYKHHNITEKTFTKKIWYFFYTLGQQMYDQGIREFDEQTTYSFVVNRPKEVNKKSYLESYNNFGGYKVIEEVIEACTNESSLTADEYHLSEIQKYESLRKMAADSLINAEDKNLVNKLRQMNLKQLQVYLQLKFKEAFINVNFGDVVEHDLADNLGETISELNEGEAMGTPLHDSPILNRKIKGWKNGALYYLVLSSGGGKSSIAMEKFILSSFENREKTLLAINEESVTKWRTLLLATVSSKILNRKINREKLYEGSFDQDMLDKLNSAKDWIVKNGKGLIKTFELKKYRFEDILNRIELYRPKGYTKLIIDTFKPDRSKNDLARWEAFSNSAQDLNDIIKEDNYNVGTLATVQLKLGKETRYLDLDSIGKSMEIVEVASVVMMGRLLFDDEYPNGKKALHPYNWRKDAFDGKWHKVPYELNKKKRYLVLFLSKNRFGPEDEQIIYEANYEINQFKEVALVKVPRYGD